MRAVIAKQPGGPEQLAYTEMDDPVLNTGEILIEVHATTVNRTDILNREGKTGYAQNPIIGIEVAGLVAETNGNKEFSIGDRVMGLVNGGAYAEKVAMPANRAMRIPESLSFEEAAAIPEVFLTAFQTLYWLGNLKKHETVLVHAGGSGVGTAAIQLAKKLSQAQVLTTAGTEEKLQVCKQLGADVLINYKSTSFDEKVLEATNEKGAHLILDFIGASYWSKNYRSVSTDGRWVLIGVLGGSTVESVKLMDLMVKRIQLTGTLLTPRSDQYKADLTKDFMKRTSALFENKSLLPIIDQIFPIEEVAKAHQHMESNKNIGKIILKVK
ncbi:NAD(P)H-quinone oxidoreductase [Gracilibacillus kekensis]|uniref:Putative NAD(P)H quinone oxidoreductase, PIG3 family n=1 Tax=Gracilibacillus kekensis TaxID=1027249 RepID=A0A1M7JK39_9BACI|nr:NAD(P)H-quinone oxidoreductase [Gracilibacillus kekensis]SHM53374.1 putative NAD(P)H quinone oxidoreductase, PIG3 family [Gracilibacillus kekensis]